MFKLMIKMLGKPAIRFRSIVLIEKPFQICFDPAGSGGHAVIRNLASDIAVADTPRPFRRIAFT
jgi:hypothetical protein